MGFFISSFFVIGANYTNLWHNCSNYKYLSDFSGFDFFRFVVSMFSFFWLTQFTHLFSPKHPD